MSITSDRIRENGFIHALADDAAEEIELLEKENARLIEVCKHFKSFIDMRGGRWAEMKEILDSIQLELNDES